MMSDKEFAELELRATICPGQCAWPKSEHVHWQKLHAAANEARARVRLACMEMDEIDRNVGLSRDDKYRQRSKTAEEAMSDFEASKTLARACQAVELAEAKHAQDREAMLKAKKEVERGWQRAMDRVAERAGLAKVPMARGAIL